MKDFKQYLQEKHYRPSSINSTMRYVNRFLSWSEDENLQPSEISYTDLLGLLKDFRKQNFSAHNINCHLKGIQHYIDWLILRREAKHNPAANLRIRGSIEQLPSDILSRKQLDEIYERYQAKTPVQKRNKIITGFAIYQGLIQDDLQSLEPTHINLQKGIIKVPKTIRLQSRVLKLSANQILPLNEYLQEIRPELQKQKRNP